MSRVIESSTGAQILPPVDDERAHWGTWVVQSAISADLRARSTPHRLLAERMRVVA